MLPALEYPSKSSGGQRDSNAHYRHLIVLPTCPRTCDGGYAFLAQVLFPPKLIPLTRRMAERNLFRAKFNSDYNDFVARVALEVVDSSWCKQQLRVKSAGSRTTASHRMRGASQQPLFAFAYFLSALPRQRPVSEGFSDVPHLSNVIAVVEGKARDLVSDGPGPG